MTSSILTGRPAQCLAATIVALALGACTDEATPAPTPAPTEPRPSATASPTPTASSSPSATPSATVSATRTPSATPTGPVSTSTPPAGYAQSCAKDIAWGRQVSQPFVCLDAPDAGAKVKRGASLTVRGYAGGSFENNVVIEVHTLVDREPTIRLVQTPYTYHAPDLGMPGAFQVTVGIPPAAPLGPTRVTAYFGSPRGLPGDERIAVASVDITVE